MLLGLQYTYVSLIAVGKKVPSADTVHNSGLSSTLCATAEITENSNSKDCTDPGKWDNFLCFLL